MRHGPVILIAILAGCRETMVPDVPAPIADPSANWQSTLHEVVTRDGYVDYDRLEERRESLDQYVAWIASERAWRGVRTTERIADWVNTYNALVLYQVLERKRPISVLEVSGWLPQPGARFFAETQFKVGRNYLSLSEIEHERVRMAHLDYRVHAVLNCASRSCPPLRRDLYSHRGFPLQLREQFMIWMDDNRGFIIENGQLLFNPIFEWYARDFAFWSGGQSLCDIAGNYTTGRRAMSIATAAEAGCTYGYFEYDWSLNHQSMQ